MRGSRIHHTVCPNCLHINEASSHFCAKCGTPMDSFATTSPFERTLSEGNSLLKGTHPNNARSLIWMWMECGWGIFLFVGVLASALCGLADWKAAGELLLFASPLTVWSTVMLAKAHMNYKRLKLDESDKCLSCGAEMPKGGDRCAKCGWTWKS